MVSLLVVTIGLVQDTYNFDEDAGIIYVAVSIKEGSLDQDITVQITAIDDTAKSKHNNNFLLCIINVHYHVMIRWRGLHIIK